MSRTLPQLSIWVAAPYSDPDTSRDAAKSIEKHLQRLECVVLFALDEGPQTTEQIERTTGLGGSTVRPRLVALRARGLVTKSDERRRTASGRMAAVWRRA
jgi:DNA-binding IclR family transcriptional regulator